jgi:hypothetical protein
MEGSNTSSSVMSQVFVVVAAGSVLSFIIRELGEPAIASWVIQVHNLDVDRAAVLTLSGPSLDAISLVPPRGTTLGRP